MKVKKKYFNSIIFAFLILLSILVICDFLDLQDDDIISYEINLIKTIIFVLADMAIVQYIHKIICRLKTNRKKLFKLQLYVKEDIVGLFKEELHKEMIKNCN